MSGKMMEMLPLSRATKRAARQSAAARPVKSHRNWTNLSVFVILALAMMSALAGLGVLLFVLVDEIIAMLG